MARLSLVALALLACGELPCEHSPRAYDVPEHYPPEACVGMLALEDSIIAVHGTSACDTEASYGYCSVIQPWQRRLDQLPAFFVTSHESRDPLLVEVPCSVESCSAIRRAVLVTQGELP